LLYTQDLIGDVQQIGQEVLPRLSTPSEPPVNSIA